MVLRKDKEVDNKVSEKKHNKEKRPKTNEIDHEIENNSSPSSNSSDPVVAYKPRVPYPQILDEPFPSRKDKHREDILETFKRVRINLPFRKQ